MKQQKNNGTSFLGLTFVGIMVCLLIGGVVYQYKNPRVEVKEVQVEVQKSITKIEVAQTFDLTGAEYTRKVMQDVHITSYNNHTNQTDDTPNVTSTSRPVRDGIVAVSRDFLNKGWAKYGDLVYIDCFNRWYLIEDTMHERHTKHIDVFLFDKSESLKVNKKCGIEIIHITK